MDNFWKKYKEYIILIIASVILGAVFTFTAKYLLGEISAKNDGIEKETIDHRESEKRLSEISNLREQFEIIEQEKSKLAVFASQDQTIALIKEMEKIAEETNNEIVIEKVEIQDENSKKKTKNKTAPNKSGEAGKEFNFPSENYISAKINLQGSYNDAVNFIRKIENMNYCADIISIQMSARESKLVSQPSEIHSKKSSLLVGKNPILENNKDKVAIRETTGEAIIDSVLELVFYVEKEAI